MSKLGTLVQVGKGYVAVNHKGNSIEVQKGVVDKEGPDTLSIAWLKKYADHPIYGFPGSMVFDVNAEKPLPMLQSAIPEVTPVPVIAKPSNGNTVLIKHKYDTQRDNHYKPGSACAPTSIAMVCSAYGINVSNGGEDPASWIYRRLESRYGQRIAGTVGCMKALLEKDFGFKDEVVWNLSREKYMNHIKNGGCVVLHTKAHSLTRSGHVIPLFGYELKAPSNSGLDSVISSDPWGVALKGTYRYNKSGGHKVRYSFNWILSSKTVLAAHMLTHPTKKVQFE